MPALTTAVVGGVAERDIGAASGIVNTVRQLDGAFGVAIVAAVLAADGSGSTSGSGPAIAAASAVVGAAVVLVLPRPVRSGIAAEPILPGR